MRLIIAIKSVKIYSCRLRYSVLPNPLLYEFEIQNFGQYDPGYQQLCDNYCPSHLFGNILFVIWDSC